MISLFWGCRKILKECKYKYCTKKTNQMFYRPFSILNIFAEEGKKLEDVVSFLNNEEDEICKNCNYALKTSCFMIKPPKYLIISMDKDSGLTFDSFGENIKVFKNFKENLSKEFFIKIALKFFTSL